MALENMAVVFPAYPDSITNHSIYGLVEFGRQAVANKLNLAQITLEVRGAILDAQRSLRCLALS